LFTQNTPYKTAEPLLGEYLTLLRLILHQLRSHQMLEISSEPPQNLSNKKDTSSNRS